MKRQGLILWTAAAIVIGGYAVYDYTQSEYLEKKKQESAGISAINKDQVSQFSIQTDKLTIEVKKQVDGWRLLKPTDDNANQQGSKEFLNGIANERYLEIIKEGPGIDWSAYGLDKPAGTIRLQSEDNSVESIAVGSIKNFEGNSYLRVNDQNKVILASSTWFAKLDKKVSDFRDQRLMRLPNSQVVRLIFEHEKEKFILTRKEGQWLNMDRLQIRIDQNKVREILGMLNNTEGLDFMHQGPIAGQDLKLWDLAKPALKLTAETEQGKSWIGLFSSGKDKIYRVATNEPAFVMKISPVDSQKFLLADFDSFRDRREAFQFNRDRVKKIIFSGAERSFDEEILRKVEKLIVTSFVEAKDQLDQEIKFLTDEGAEVFWLKWGKPRKIFVAGSETSVVPARSSAVDYAFYITEQEINALKLKDHDK